MFPISVCDIPHFYQENDEDYDDSEDDDDPRKNPPPKVDIQKVFQAGGSQEDILKASKKGQPLMIFVTVAGNPTKKRTEEVSMFWQTSLQNNNIQVQRYIVIMLTILRNQYITCDHQAQGCCNSQNDL